MPARSWSTRGEPLSASAETWPLDGATGIGPSGSTTAISVADHGATTAAVLVPNSDVDGGGPPGRRAVLCRAGVDGDPEVTRPRFTDLPLGVLGTPVGELVVTSAGFFVDGRPIPGPAGPVTRLSPWVLLGRDRVGVTVTTGGDGGSASTIAGVLDVSRRPSWHGVTRSVGGGPVRWVEDATEPHLVWWSHADVRGTEFGRLDLRSGATARTRFEGILAMLLTADSAGDEITVLLANPRGRVAHSGHQVETPSSMSVHSYEVDLV